MNLLENISSRVRAYVSTYLNTRIVFLLDLVVSMAASLTVLLLVNILSYSIIYMKGFTVLWIFFGAVWTILLEILTRSYRVIIRHTTIKDIARYAIVSAGKTALTGCSFLILNRLGYFPLTQTILLIAFADFFVTCFFLVSLRVLMIMAYDAALSRHGKAEKSILVYGTSDKSVATLIRLKTSPHYKIQGFIAPGRKKKLVIDDNPVYYYGDDESIGRIFRDTEASAVLFTSEKDVRTEAAGLVRVLSQMGKRVLLAPGIGDVTEGNLPGNAVREVKIEDLLGRDEISISLDAIRRDLSGKVVMVTGAAGSIGSELCRQIARMGVARIIMFDNAETPMYSIGMEFAEKFSGIDCVTVIGDVRSVDRLDFVFRQYKPQIVFHAAAYKHVPMMEDNPCEAVAVNVAGTRNVADRCVLYGVEKMVMISTDKAVNPTNVMGCSKRLAEIYVQSLGLSLAESGRSTPRFVTTRFGNVLGSNGSVIPRFRSQILAGGPVTVTHPDITRFFMTIPEACELVLEASVLPLSNVICVFDMGEPVKIDTLARRMVELSGLRPDVDIAIKYTGLRPGEKLYEEVLATAEDTAPTSHDRIRIANVRKYDIAEVREFTDRLTELSAAVNIPEMLKLMKKVVPEYVSNNSKFCIYDKK